jgi:hypothetical protein
MDRNLTNLKKPIGDSNVSPANPVLIIPRLQYIQKKVPTSQKYANVKSKVGGQVG